MTIHVTPIPRLIDLAAPAFTLGTANAAGSAETAVASNATLLAFDAVAPANIGTASAGSATVSGRRDHVHAGTVASLDTDATGAELDTLTDGSVTALHSHSSPVLSMIVAFSRSASAGSGSQALTGVGFAPTALIVLATNNGSEEASWGLGDDNDDQGDLFTTSSANYSRGDTNIIQLSNAAGNDMVAVLTSLDADGFTVTWTKSGSGLAASAKVLCLR